MEGLKSTVFCVFIFEKLRFSEKWFYIFSLSKKYKVIQNPHLIYYFRPFREIINSDKKNAGSHLPQGNNNDRNQLASLRAVTLEHYASHVLS